MSKGGYHLNALSNASATTGGLRSQIDVTATTTYHCQRGLVQGRQDFEQQQT